MASRKVQQQSTACNSHGGSAGRIDFESETFVVGALQGGGSPRGHGTAGINSQAVAAGHIVPVAFSCKDHGADAQRDLSPTLRAGGHDGSHANAGVPPAIAFQTRIARNGRGQPEEICPALNGSDAGATSDMRPVLATSSAVRRLTPRECERLQGFPDDYTLISYRGKPAADGPRYKALGNSMAVPVMRWILSRIEQVATPVPPLRKEGGENG